MTAWTGADLSRFGAAEEIEIAAVRQDGTVRAPRIIWVVRAGDELYVRAAYGPGSGWHRVARTSGHARISAQGVEQDVNIEAADERVLDQIDAACREKYGRRYASIVDTITDPEHRATTLRLLPRGAS
jgi:hypothetical protein